MGKQENFSAIVLICLFFILGLLLYFTTEKPDGPSRSIENNVIIEQRMKNLSGGR